MPGGREECGVPIRGPDHHIEGEASSAWGAISALILQALVYERVNENIAPSDDPELYNAAGHLRSNKREVGGGRRACRISSQG